MAAAGANAAQPAPRRPARQARAHSRVVVHDLGVGLVEALRQVGLSHGQADGVADTLAEGAWRLGGWRAGAGGGGRGVRGQAGRDVSHKARSPPGGPGKRPPLLQPPVPGPTAPRLPACARAPVVTSTPGVRKFSGWPGVELSHWRNDLMSSSCAGGGWGVGWGRRGGLGPGGRKQGGARLSMRGGDLSAAKARAPPQGARGHAPTRCRSRTGASRRTAAWSRGPRTAQSGRG
jgi:hypothetical protein